MQFMTREVFDLLIIIVIIIGLIAAFFRLRADLTRPLPPSARSLLGPGHPKRDGAADVLTNSARAYRLW